MDSLTVVVILSLLCTMCLDFLGSLDGFDASIEKNNIQSITVNF